jgi:SAM-dependent methyltransferase
MNKSPTTTTTTFPHSDLHIKQRRIWEREHKHPAMFPTVDSNVPDPGVVRFLEYLNLRHNSVPLKGLEICCGKGRNSIWLAENGAMMTGFDFSETAIEKAVRLQRKLPAEQRVSFRLHDALQPWPFESAIFDFVIDSFGSADIESAQGRDYVIVEAARVLKKGGHYFLQIDSPERGFFAERMKSHPGPDKNTLVFPNGKIESVLTEDDLVKWDQHYPLKIVEVRRLVEHNVEICGKTIPYKYFWAVLRLP